MKIEQLKVIYDKANIALIDPFDIILENTSFESVAYLSTQYGGSSLYIPTPKRLFYKSLQKVILKEYNYNNLEDLAKKYDMCTRTIRRYIFDNK